MVDAKSEQEARTAQEPKAASPEQRLSEREMLERDLAEARKEASESQDRFLRARADMENYRKRMERTFAELARDTRKDLLRKLLGVKDNLERALQYGTSAESGEGVLEGVRLTQYQLDQLLQNEGVKQIEAQGKPFDPQYGEAVQTVNDPSVPDHTVVQVVRNGYTFGDQVLRPAQVIVSVHGDEDGKS
jgi:molecular chaperone GrpE